MLKRPLTLPLKDAGPPAEGGPVAWWKLDESDGSNAADACGNLHSSRTLGWPHWVQGQASGALALDGARDYVDCGDSADFDFSHGLTVSLWMKLNAPGESRQTVIAKGSDTWRMQTDGKNGNLLFTLNGPKTTGKDKKRSPQAKSKRSVDDGQWHHVVGIYDSKHLALYLDAELEDSIAASGSLAMNTEPVWLGNNSAARGEFFNGTLDDVRLYNRGLKEQEIQALQREAGK